MTDDTIRYLADWAALILLIGMGLTAALVLVWISTVHAQKTQKK